MDATPPLAWDDLQLLADAAQAGSLLAVARRRGLAVSTLSRRMTRLEAALGVTLLERGPQGTAVRAAARELVEVTRQFDVALAAAVRALPARGQALRGTIRVSAGDGFAPLIGRCAAAFARAHPGVRFELALEDRLADLPRREADVTLRTLHRREASLRYRALGRLAYGVFGAPALIDAVGAPRTVRDLVTRPLVSLAAPLDRIAPQAWLGARGAAVLRANTFGGQLAAVQAGVGFAALPVASATGLARVLPAARIPDLPVWLVTRASARTEPHVQAFAAALAAQALSEALR